MRTPRSGLMSHTLNTLRKSVGRGEYPHSPENPALYISMLGGFRPFIRR